jgi:hypothetical protein
MTRMKEVAGSAKPVGDARLGQVVRGHFQSHTVADGEPDKMFAHLAGHMSQHFVLVIQRNAKHGAGQNGPDRSFKFNRLFVAHKRGDALTRVRNPVKTQEVFMVVRLISNAIRLDTTPFPKIRR